MKEKSERNGSVISSILFKMWKRAHYAQEQFLERHYRFIYFIVDYFVPLMYRKFDKSTELEQTALIHTVFSYVWHELKTEQKITGRHYSLMKNEWKFCRDVGDYKGALICKIINLIYYKLNSMGLLVDEIDVYDSEETLREVEEMLLPEEIEEYLHGVNPDTCVFSELAEEFLSEPPNIPLDEEFYISGNKPPKPPKPVVYQPIFKLW